MSQPRILLGVIGRPHGVRGHVHVHSYTATPEDLAGYGTLASADGRAFGLRWVGAGVAEITEIVAGSPRRVADRTAAESLVNTQLFVERDALPPPETDEFYLADLIGLSAVGVDDAPLGTVAAVHDYGAGACVEIAGPSPLLVPFTRACIPDIDMAGRRLRVCPPAERIAAP